MKSSSMAPDAAESQGPYEQHPMAPISELGEVPTSFTDATQTRMRRRARKRKGPPQLQFVTATDPSEFKGEQVKRSVRSQAMIQYRFQSAERKRQRSEGRCGRRVATTERAVPMRQNDETYKIMEDEILPYWHDKSQLYSYSQSPEDWWDAQGQEADDAPLWAPYATEAYPHSDASTMTAIQTNAAAKHGVELQKDPPPHFLEYRRSQSLPCSTIMSSTWQDMLEGVCGESRRTILLKAETISWIKERLYDADTRFRDDTIMVILHLLMGETWSCNERTLRIHMAGLVKLAAVRGDGDVGGVFGTVGLTTAVVYSHVSIICESNSPPQLCQFQAPNFVVDTSMMIPESPLYSPREQMYTVLADPACSAHAYDMLCDVRDLTDLFLTYSSKLAAIFEEETEMDHDRLRTLSVDYDAKVAQYRTKLATMPSAYTPGLPTTNDWIYEACRLTAIIHGSAIITCVPFSVAANPAQNAVLRTAASISGNLPSKRLTESLYEALERTNTGDLWNNMAGVFYWVCAVGAAAARTPAMVVSYAKPTSHSEAYSTWVRRCLSMFSSRTLTQIILAHPQPLLAAQGKLLRIQELIGRSILRSQVSQKHF